MRAAPAFFLAAALVGTAAPATADVVELVDGRLVEGAVQKDGDVYRVRSRFGEAVVPAADVKSVTAAPPVDDQVRERLAALAADDATNRALLARWLREIGREEEARALAEAVLEIDPEEAVAHEVLGHVRHQGVWRTPEEAKRAEGLELHGDRWYTPEEWRNVSEEARRETEREEERRASARVAEEANEAVRLMLSPDPLVKARGRKRLESLAAETGSKRWTDLIAQVEELEKARDRLAAAAAALERASVLSELRLTYTKLKRPIQVFETSLAASPVTAAAPVRIQLPELEVIRINTTVGMPAVVK